MFNPDDNLPSLDSWKSRTGRGGALRRTIAVRDRRYDLTRFAKFCRVEFANGVDVDEVVKNWMALEETP